MPDRGTGPLDQRRKWDAGRDRLELVAARAEAPDVTTFIFQGEGDTWFGYLPGQSVLLTLPLPEGPVQRRFALSSSPSRPLRLAVTVKAAPDDAAARWMLERLTVGDRLHASDPSGTFTLPPLVGDKLLLVGAGIGFAPLMAMARWAEDIAAPIDLAVIQFARRPEALLFRTELEALAARMPGLRLSLVVTDPDGAAGWTGWRGRLSTSLLRLLVPDVTEREVVCCAPRGFRRELRTILDDAGCIARRWHEDEWHPDQIDPVEPVEPVADPVADPETTQAAEPEGPVIRFVDSKVTAPVVKGQTLLQIAYGAGVKIPSSCTMGLCGTCKVMRLTGKTKMRDQGGIHEDEIAAGFVLACCTWPVGSVELDA